MDFRFVRNLRLGYGFSILMLALVGFLAYMSNNQLLESNRAVTGSNLIIQKLEEAISLMKDAETGQRGYLLTGRDQFLEPYRGSPQKALRLIDETKALTAGEPSGHADVKDIRQIIARRMNILEALIGKRKNQQMITAGDLDAGKSAMDALRRATKEAEITEQRLLEQKTRRLQSCSSWTPILIINAIVLSLVFGIWSYMQVMRDIRTQERLRIELKSKEEETAAINEELSAANEEITAANEELTAINEELTEARSELAVINESLEQRVTERTEALALSEQETQALNEELTAINEELAATNEELTAINEEMLSAKNETEKSERLFKAIAQNIPGSLILVLSKTYHLIAVEGDLIPKAGYEGHHYTGKHLDEVFPERYQSSLPLYERMFKGEQLRIDQKGSDGADYQVDFVPLLDDYGQVDTGLVITLDVTEIKKAEEHSAKLAAIVEFSDDAIIGKNLDGIITSWNRGAERLFGHTAEDMVGQSILTLIPDERHGEEPGIIDKIKRGEPIEHFETKRITRDGRMIDVSLTISPIRDSNGTVTGVSKIARDISEKKLDEQRKSDFIAMASHELKTPLTSLTALIQVLDLKLGGSSDGFVPNALMKSRIQVRKMADLINGFLNVSRLESGKLHIEPITFDLHNLVQDSIEEIQLSLSNHNFQLVVDGELMVYADRDKIASVISNLLNNAVKYAPNSDTVSITCSSLNNEALIAVSDTGIGINQQDISKLFDRYYRVASSDTRHISGFGIGLYLSAEIIRHHGGKIWAESERGVGSTFYFTLPLLNDEVSS